MDKKKGGPSNCDDCEHYVYDEWYECWVCDVDLDEDEMVKFLTGSNDGCPYYRYYNEYDIVRKQN